MKKLKVLFGTAIAAVMVAGLVTLSTPQEAGACPQFDCGGPGSVMYQMMCEDYAPNCRAAAINYWVNNCGAFPC